MKIETRKWSQMTSQEKDTLFSRSETDIRKSEDIVRPIIAAVKDRGDEALISFTKEFDGADLSSNMLKVGEDEYTKAELSLSQKLKDALDFAIENVFRFHQGQKQENMEMVEIRPGIMAGERISPISSAGLYVPRGRGSFPSMLYMLAIPAVVAGVPEISIVTPPGKTGEVDAACLYAAKKCGINKIFRVGGAQAIAALAYGTEIIPKVSMVTGPGSMYVTAAKRLLYGTIDVGLPAGPSESVLIADETADPWKAALDLCIEAEHGSDSSAILLVNSEKLATTIAQFVSTIINELPEPRKTFVSDVITGYGGIIETSSLEESANISNTYAPEHLLIHMQEPFDILPLITNAGEILLGDNTPFSVANYATGANAVLPTGGNARTFSAVSVRDFVKYSSVVHCTQKGLESMQDHVIELADYEGFVTHAGALRNRKTRGSYHID